ncbi:hypothetical protein VTN00DRAFT_9660 [Thermoascus crustaceus]|uniref:uncharacterized protein n=1 Tax=Thermoascus crustaceus TaxID=5088 RepID=UPI003742ABB8
MEQGQTTSENTLADAISAKDVNLQLQSSLFGLLPAEIRKLILEFALLNEDHDYYCMCIYFILAIYAIKTNEYNQDDLNSNKAIREKVEERVREMMDNSESANYVVVFLVLKPGLVDKGQITSAESLSKACP